MAGLFLCAVFLEIGLRVGGFIFLSIQEYRNRISLRQKGSYRIMCLGESTTDNAYPTQLQRTLNQRNIGIRFSVINKGVSGTDTEVILSRLEYNLDKYNPDMVIAMMGANDSDSVMSYEGILPKKNTRCLNSLRTYQLVKLIKLHIINKIYQSSF